MLNISKQALRYYREFDAKAKLSFEKHVRLPYSAQVLINQKDKACTAEARQLLEEAVADPRPRPYYLNWAQALLAEIAEKF